MPLTRANVETILIARCGRLLTLSGLNGTTQDGTNVALADPIRQGLSSVSIVTATLGIVADDDLAMVDSTTIDEMLDVAELRALESCLGNLDQPDQMADTNNEQWLGRLRDSIEKTVARKQALLQKQYGVGLGSLSTGVLDLGFAETIDPATGIPN